MNQVLESTGLHNQVLESTGLHNQVLESTGLHNQVLESTGLHNQVLESTGLPKCLNLLVYTVEVSVITIGILQEVLEGSDTMFTLNQFLVCPLCGLIIKINISIAKICIWILSNALYIKHYTFI